MQPSKRRNLNPRIAPDAVNHFNEISKAQMLNIDSKIPEFFRQFLNEESFSEIGKNILKYTNLFQNLAPRLQDWQNVLGLKNFVPQLFTLNQTDH